MRQYIQVSKKGPTSLAALFTIVLILLLWSCAGSSSGGLSRSNEVSNLFESYQILPDHAYYFSGSSTNPRAVVGIQKEYTLVSDYWHPIEPTPEQMKGWRDWTIANSGRDAYRHYGSWILAGDGSRVGVWYPYQDRNAYSRVEVKEDKTVTISIPSEPERERSLMFDY